MAFKVIQSNPSFGSPSAPSLGSFMTKERKGYQTVFDKIASKWNMDQFDLLTFKIDLLDDSTKSTFVQYFGTLLIKLHAKEEKKLSNSFSEIKILSEKLTTTDDDGRRTNRH